MNIYVVDAFTKEPFKGNPAGVCLLEKPAKEIWMHNVAMEMNLSETAFLYPQKDGFHLRWFTPAVEVDLCGHATLGTSHILWETGVLDKNRQARYNTRSGLLTASYNNGFIEMDFPATPATEIEKIAGLTKALGADSQYIGKNACDYLVLLNSEQTVKNMRPDFGMLKQITDRGVIVTAQSDSREFDFVSRFFAPAVGIDEDPVTGSAHCTLGPFWAERLGKNALTALQASQRSGIVNVTVNSERVILGGHAVTVMKSELLR